MSIRSQYSDVFLADALPVLDALIYEEYEKYPDAIPMIFRVMSSKNWGEQTTTMAGIKPALTKPEGENVAFDDALQGFDKTYQHVTYAIATSFSEELTEDDRLSLVEDTYRSLGLAMYQTRQVVAVNIINNGFTDTGPDGATLFSTSHTMIGGHTYANRPSTDIALSVAGMREMEVDMMRQVNHRNINIYIMPRVIWAPPELAQTLKELIESPERPDTPNRAINSFYSFNYQGMVSPYLTSTTAWGALADKTQHQMRFYERVAPQTRSWIDDPSGDVNTRIRSRFSVGYSDFIGTWGTTG